MKISIITPTHDPKFLRELQDTILAQTMTDWEWIILLNQGAKWEASDPRIKTIECPFVSNAVGFLKRLACMQASGDIIAEVDHDDLLVNTCLEKVARAFEDPEIGFVFSRNAKLSKDFIPYMPEYGWSYDMFRWKGHALYAMFNQPVYPGRLGHIYYAPDHIRAWRRSVYESIGGHDDSLQLCDDLDLMHRLYKVTRFKEIPEVLYIYRMTGQNTYRMNGKLIREIDSRLYERNIIMLAKRFCELNGLKEIDLGLMPGNTLSDMPENSVGLIQASDVLQYLVDPRTFMAEAHRALAPGGILITETPSTDGRGAFQDPAALSMWNENSFSYYFSPSLARRSGIKSLFRQCRLETVFRNDTERELKIPYVIAHLEKLI